MNKTKEIENQFVYHPPTPDQIIAYQMLRDCGKDLAMAIQEVCPAGIERDAAILKVREAVMMANAAIACSEPIACSGRPQVPDCCL